MSDKLVKEPVGARGRVYGTVIYIPEDASVDFGSEKDRTVCFDKSVSSPRVLLVSTWVDGLWGFAGGKMEPDDETPVQTMNREFIEETGCDTIEFTDDHLAWIRLSGDTNYPSYFYIFKTANKKEFEQVVGAFEGRRPKGYVDEIFAVAGLPIWFEGPSNLDLLQWGDGIHGLPKIIQAMTPGISGSKVATDTLVLCLLYTGIMTMEQMKRVDDMAAKLNHDRFLEKVMKIDGIENILT